MLTVTVLLAIFPRYDFYKEPINKVDVIFYKWVNLQLLKSVLYWLWSYKRQYLFLCLIVKWFFEKLLFLVDIIYGHFCRFFTLSTQSFVDFFSFWCLLAYIFLPLLPNVWCLLSFSIFFLLQQQQIKGSECEQQLLLCFLLCRVLKRP